MGGRHIVIYFISPAAAARNGARHRATIAAIAPAPRHYSDSRAGDGAGCPGAIQGEGTALTSRGVFQTTNKCALAEAVFERPNKEEILSEGDKCNPVIKSTKVPERNVLSTKKEQGRHISRSNSPHSETVTWVHSCRSCARSLHSSGGSAPGWRHVIGRVACVYLLHRPIAIPPANPTAGRRQPRA